MNIIATLEGELEDTRRKHREAEEELRDLEGTILAMGPTTPIKAYHYANSMYTAKLEYVNTLVVNGNKLYESLIRYDQVMELITLN